MLTSRELRQKYIEFFQSKGHAVIPSASLIPENDPTVLFTTAGMHPLVPYLLGEKHPSGIRLTNVQKCVRLQDIDEVGDNRHDTFFEMLGNWSFGDPSSSNGFAKASYWKKEAISWSWEFLTSPEWLGLDKRKMAVSVFAGDEHTPRDEESAEIWRLLGVPEHKIVFLSRDHNWWGLAGKTGPCGPDTEMFYWKGETEFPPDDSNPATDEENWLEIWNDVFLQYNKKIKKTHFAHEKREVSLCSRKARIKIDDEYEFEPLEQKNVDTGMGLERTLVALNGYVDVFQVDTFWPLIQKIEEISGREYIENIDVTRAMRIVADHLRTATMIMADENGIAPSNVEHGYVVRRLIRRAVRYGKMLGIQEHFCSRIAEKVVEVFADVYPEVVKNRDFTLTEISKEEGKFKNTIEKGLKEFEKLAKGFQTTFEKTGERITQISGKHAFKLYDTCGFPLEMTEELAVENALTVDAPGFWEEFKKHQQLSRAGAEQKFRGGLADYGEMSVKYHTATHLLNAALRQALGAHVSQKGSNITAERLRFDFSHPEKMTEEQKRQVEDLVNAAIARDYPVSWEETTIEDAKQAGALGAFEGRYAEKVKVYSVGDPNQPPTGGQDSPTFSKEICGGPHVERTGALGKFKIVKEEAVSAGVRRIKAILSNLLIA